jgi:HEPN domain-containing protein
MRVLAVERLSDAEALCQAGRYAAAYYMAGYAVECGLKAVITKNLQPFHMPETAVRNAYIHDLERLVNLAKLQASKDALERNDVAFKANWLTVRDWSEASRYEAATQGLAQGMIDAVRDPLSGVLEWIRKNW